MANWCENHLLVEGHKRTVSKFVNLAKGKIGKELSCLSFRSLSPFEENDKSPQDIWQWRLDTWGTTREPVDASLERTPEGYADYIFDTAWSPPDLWTALISKQFPTLVFTLSYAELGMGFAGRIRVQNGEVITDERASLEDEPKGEAAMTMAQFDTFLHSIGHCGISHEETKVHA